MNPDEISQMTEGIPAWIPEWKHSPSFTAMRLPVWMSTLSGEVYAGTYSQAICEADPDEADFWVTSDGERIENVAYWMQRVEGQEMPAPPTGEAPAPRLVIQDDPSQKLAG